MVGEPSSAFYYVVSGELTEALNLTLTLILTLIITLTPVGDISSGARSRWRERHKVALILTPTLTLFGSRWREDHKADFEHEPHSQPPQPTPEASH